jgi:hypothetical protein
VADERARAAARRFVASLVTDDARGMFAECSLPWVDRAELIPDEPALERRLAEYRVPAVFARGEEHIALLASLEELEQALGKQVPESARETWTDLLAGGSRIAVVRRGPMLVGLALRPSAESAYRVSGLLFDYFPRPDDPLLRAVTTAPAHPVERGGGGASR